MTLIAKSSAVTLAYNLGTSLTLVFLSGVSKAGSAFAAPHLGTVTSLGNGWYSVQLDATDTNTVGALALHFSATLGTPSDPQAEQVANSPMALVPNDTTAQISIDKLTIGATAGVALTITANDGVSDAVFINSSSAVGLHVQGHTDAIAASGTNGAGLDCTGGAEGIIAYGVAGHGAVFTGNFGGNGINIDGQVGVNVTGAIAAEFSGSNTGILVAAGSGTGLQIVTGGAGPAMSAYSSSGNGIVVAGQIGMSIHGNDISVDCEGGTAGMRCAAIAGDGMQLQGWNSALSVIGSSQAIYINGVSGPGVTLTSLTDGVDILAGNIGVSIFGQGGAGLAVQGSTDALALIVGTGFPVNYGGTEMSLAFADEILNLANGIETGYTVKQSLRLMLSAMCGLSSFATPTRIYRDVNNTVNRIDATVDIAGQRLTVVLNAT